MTRVLHDKSITFYSFKLHWNTDLYNFQQQARDSFQRRRTEATDIDILYMHVRVECISMAKRSYDQNCLTRGLNDCLLTTDLVYDLDLQFQESYGHD